MKKRLVLIILCGILSGCSWFEDNRVVVKPEPIDTTSPEFRRNLSFILKGRYENESADEILRWIAADLAAAADKEHLPK